MRFLKSFHKHEIAVVRWSYGFLQDWCNLSHHGAVRVFLALQITAGFMIWQTDKDAVPLVSAVMVSAIEEYVHAVAPSRSKQVAYFGHLADIRHLIEVLMGITTLIVMGSFMTGFVTGKSDAVVAYRFVWQFGINMLVCDQGEDDNERGRKIKEALNALKSLLGPKQHVEPAVGLN